MDKLFAAISNMFRVPDLRKRVLFTLGLLAVYRFGAHVTAPGIDQDQSKRVWSEVGSTLLGVLDLFSAGTSRRSRSSPSASRPTSRPRSSSELMTTVFPQLKKLQEEGDAGRQKINQYTRYLTVVLALFQTFIVARWLQANAVGADSWASS